MAGSGSSQSRVHRWTKSAALLRRARARAACSRLTAALAGARRQAREAQAEQGRLQQEVQAKNRFLAALSHELRAPLNAVIGFADVLASGVVPADSPRHPQYLGHIRDRGLHLLQLINDVIDLSRVDAGDWVPCAEPVELHALIGGVVEVLHTRILHKRLHVEVEVAPGLRQVVADAARLKQALAGFLGRAVDDSPAGGRIQVRVRPHGHDRFRIEVQDGGPGLPPERLAAAFDASAGLGLALARRMVEAQGGTVALRSLPGQGSAFVMTLRRAPPGHAGVQDAAAPEQAAPSKAGACSGSGPRR